MTVPVIVTDSETLRQIVREELAALHHSPAQAHAPLKLAYTIPEASEISGQTQHQIRYAITHGELPARQAGSRGAYTIHHEHLDAWLRGVAITHADAARKGVRQAKKPA